MSECFYLTWHCLYISPPVNCYYIYLILLNSLSLQHTCFLLINWIQVWYRDLQGYSTWMQGLPFHFVYSCWISLHDCLVIWFLTSLHVRPIIPICFDISIPHLAHRSKGLSPLWVRTVWYHHHTVQTQSGLSPCDCERMCHIYSWYLWPRGQIYNKVFSSPELKAQVSFSDHLSSVSKLLTFSSSSQEPLGQFQLNLAQRGPSPFPRGDNYEIAKINWRN